MDKQIGLWPREEFAHKSWGFAGGPPSPLTLNTKFSDIPKMYAAEEPRKGDSVLDYIPAHLWLFKHLELFLLKHLPKKKWGIGGGQIGGTEGYRSVIDDEAYDKNEDYARYEIRISGKDFTQDGKKCYQLYLNVYDWNNKKYTYNTLGDFIKALESGKMKKPTNESTGTKLEAKIKMLKEDLDNGRIVADYNQEQIKKLAKNLATYFIDGNKELKDNSRLEALNNIYTLQNKAMSDSTITVNSDHYETITSELNKDLIVALLRYNNKLKEYGNKEIVDDIESAPSTVSFQPLSLHKKFVSNIISIFFNKARVTHTTLTNLWHKYNATNFYTVDAKDRMAAHNFLVKQFYMAFMKFSASLSIYNKLGIK